MLAASANILALAGGGTPVKGGGPMRPVLEVGPAACASSCGVEGAARSTPDFYSSSAVAVSG